MLNLPAIRGVIDRRILANFRVDHDVLAATLPAPFRPQLVNGYGIAGICLIRLKSVRPRGMPAWLGVSSENAAHRIAVEWNDGDAIRTGVYIRRRDTNSRFSVLAGGRLFPGVHHHARFVVQETAEELSLDMQSDDGVTAIKVRGHADDAWPTNSIFPAADAASQFFAAGSFGYSNARTPNVYQGLELDCDTWTATPLAIESIRSSYFDDRTIFPAGSIEFDNALLMRGIDHEWHSRGELCCSTN
ncbi:DUF2071 domain-containing protein [Lacipirellula parvula]|uniref:DUF2071 domain-containing protein n=1 Tax=Lacipirellula parvula TaxID=2650471 RepID=A0A5K7XRB9_9BACT|nr:DUF2071 domain-containing protein [Lacipirellula parvula]BBO36439.1 hypothetical protein PLANPX_6051 [Lacipirellula parvula]